MPKNNQPIRRAPLEPHDLCSIFPPMGDEPYKLLLEDMKKNGYDPKHPIVLFEGKILDGANRYTAARKLKLNPPEIQYTGDDPIGFVIEQNLARRHLTPSQAATLGADLMERLKAKDKADKAEEKSANLQTKKGAKPAKKAKGEKAAAAAKVSGSSKRNVAKAAALKKNDPKGFQEVKEGKKTLHAATKDAEVKKSAAEQKSDAYAAAVKIIDEAVGSDGFTLRIAKKINSKDILQLSGLDKEEILRIKPMLESGWGLKTALNYKPSSFTHANNIRQLIDRATAQGGMFTLEMDDWVISVTKKTQVK